MRVPTPRAEIYRWHTAALAGRALQITDDPQCGWYKRRLVKGGPFVPARIWMAQEVDEETGELVADEVMQCEVNGRRADPEDAWSWICSDPITEQEYRYLEARIAYAIEHEPEDSYADPHKPIDLNQVPPLF